jgi:predicted PurR-regulated permease PerM
MFMMPVIVAELSNLVPVFVNYAKKPQNEKFMKDQIAPLAAKYPSINESQIDQIMAMLKDNNRVRFFQTSIAETACELEVWCGIFLIVSLLLPTRDFMCLFMWWQYLKLRYMSDNGSNGIKKAFTKVDNTINEQLLSRSWVPGIVHNLYAKIKGFLAAQAVPPSSASAGGAGGLLSGLTSKCSIM